MGGKKSSRYRYPTSIGHIFKVKLLLLVSMMSGVHLSGVFTSSMGGRQSIT